MIISTLPGAVSSVRPNIIPLRPFCDEGSPKIRFVVRDDSLYNPLSPFAIEIGETLVAKKNFSAHEINCRALCLVRIISTGEIMARFVCTHPASLRSVLRALNPAYAEQIFDSDDIEIIGLVTGRSR